MQLLFPDVISLAVLIVALFVLQRDRSHYYKEYRWVFPKLARRRAFSLVLGIVIYFGPVVFLAVMAYSGDKAFASSLTAGLQFASGSILFIALLHRSEFYQPRSHGES